MLWFSSIFLMIMISSPVGAEPTAVVNTTVGPVQGEILTTIMKSIRYSSFIGIRYAEPPLGWNRFKPPIPVRPWVEVFNATTEGDACIQVGSADDHVIGSEDCLFLNVFTPKTNFEDKPTELMAVIVWIFGGAWRLGTTTTNVYGPDFLIDKNVIMVSFNHRLGPLGFLNLNHPNATGNAGLKDQRLVLKWVQANIENFGGDPNNVTILGASSGGMSAMYHTISDGSAGLFHGTIAMSATPLIPWAFQKAVTIQQRLKEFATWLGVNTTDQLDLLDLFYNTSADDLARGTFLIDEVVAFTPSIENVSIAEDPIFTECFVKKWYTGNFTKIPQIIGSLSLETVPFACAGTGAHMQTIDSHIAMSKMIGLQVPECIYTFKEIYGNGTDDWNLFNQSLIEDTLQVTTDLIFTVPVDMMQQILAAHNDGKPVYYYRITFDYPRSLHKLRWNCTFEGPGHGDELAYLFTVPLAKYTVDLNDSLALTREKITTMWTNFAKYGNPTPHWVDNEYDVGITWPESGLAGIALDISDNLSIISRPIEDKHRLIESYAWPSLPEAADCN